MNERFKRTLARSETDSTNRFGHQGNDIFNLRRLVQAYIRIYRTWAIAPISQTQIL